RQHTGSDQAPDRQQRLPLLAPAHRRTGRPRRAGPAWQQKQRPGRDSSSALLFWGGLWRPVAFVAGGRCLSCVLAKLLRAGVERATTPPQGNTGGANGRDTPEVPATPPHRQRSAGSQGRRGGARSGPRENAEAYFWAFRSEEDLKATMERGHADRKS